MSTNSDGDSAFMTLALSLAERGRYTTRPNPCVGCVLTKDGVSIAQGWHEHAGGPHAEISALRAAGSAAQASCCYVSLEPCCHEGKTPPCTKALIEAGVAKVVVAMEDPNPKVRGAGIGALRAAGVIVETGLMAQQAASLNQGFIRRMERQRPLLRLKLAATLDGRTATRHGQSKWITSNAARKDVQHWRALSGAVLTGIGTVLADDPRLTVREDSLLGAAGQPLRVVVDSKIRIPLNARLFEQDGQTLLVSVTHPHAGERHASIEGVEVLTLPASDGQVPLTALLEELAAREINDVLVESGSVLAGALLKQDLVDELVLYLAPSLLGDSARGLVKIDGLENLENAIGLEYRDVRRIGPDLRVVATLAAGKV